MAFLRTLPPGLLPSHETVRFFTSLIDRDEASIKEKTDSALRTLREHYPVAMSGAATLRYQRLMTFALWPERLVLATDQEVAGLRPSPGAEPTECDASQFYSRKMNRCVRHRSQLEMSFRTLECVDDVLGYRKHPFAVSYDVAGKESSFRPDLILVLKDRRCLVVGTRPPSGWSGCRYYQARGYGARVVGRRPRGARYRRTL